VTVGGCGPAPPSPEHQTLTNFFRASRARDTTVLARSAAVVFEPRRDGTVQQFDITESGAERRLADDRLAKDVTVRAQVRTPDGQMVARTYVATMERGAGPRPDRWFITAFNRQ
jgi:hypothetical protein